MIRVHMYIYGNVTGVGFRYWIKGVAQKPGLTGWVKNARSDCVEAVFEGDKKNVLEMADKCHQGPEVAWVEKVEVKDEEYKGEFKSFEIVR